MANQSKMVNDKVYKGIDLTNIAYSGFYDSRIQMNLSIKQLKALIDGEKVRHMGMQMSTTRD